MHKITDQLIEHLEAKARERINHELRFDYLHDTLSNEPILAAGMPIISMTRTANFRPDTKLNDAEEHIREKVFNYFYAEIFDYMRAIAAQDKGV